MNPVISREYIRKNYIHKDKIREIKEKIHNELDGNGITRVYQLNVDKYFNELLEETEDDK